MVELYSKQEAVEVVKKWLQEEEIEKFKGKQIRIIIDDEL